MKRYDEYKRAGYLDAAHTSTDNQSSIQNNRKAKTSSAE